MTTLKDKLTREKYWKNEILAAEKGKKEQNYKKMREASKNKLVTEMSVREKR